MPHSRYFNIRGTQCVPLLLSATPPRLTAYRLLFAVFSHRPGLRRPR